MIKEVFAATPISNPLVQSTLGPVAFISRLLSTLINLAFLAGAVFFFFTLIIGAIGWIGAGGDKGKLEDAKGKITSALIGIIVLFGVYAALGILQNFIGVQLLTFTIYNIAGLSMGTIDLSPIGQFSGLTGVSIQSLVSSLITLALILGTIIFLFMLISGGILWIASGGDKGKLEEARERIKHALIGIFILFGVWAIASVIGIFFGVQILNFSTGKPPAPITPPIVIPSVTPVPTVPGGASPTPPGGATPTNPPIPPWCNLACNPPSCPSGSTCTANGCRNVNCTSDSDCLCSTTVTCAQACNVAYPNNTNSFCTSASVIGLVRATAGDSSCTQTQGLPASVCWCTLPAPTATPTPVISTWSITGNVVCNGVPMANQPIIIGCRFLVSTQTYGYISGLSPMTLQVNSPAPTDSTYCQAEALGIYNPNGLIPISFSPSNSNVTFINGAFGSPDWFTRWSNSNLSFGAYTINYQAPPAWCPSASGYPTQPPPPTPIPGTPTPTRAPP